MNLPAMTAPSVPASSSDATGAPAPASRPLPLRDPAARMYILTRLVASFDESDQRSLAELMGCGFTPELIDKLRSMSMVDALKFTASQCGLAIQVDGEAVRRQLGALDRARADRQLYEQFIRAGASPHLISRLFSVSSTDVRRLRKMIAPEVAIGGRPRSPQEPVRSDIATAWARIRAAEPSERQAYWLLHREFTDLPIAALETVVAADESGSAVHITLAWPGSPTQAHAAALN